MLQKYPNIKRTLKWTLISSTSLLVILIVLGIWFVSLLPREEMKERWKMKYQRVNENLSYLSENVIPKRGKILAVVTSSNTMGSSGGSTGYELTELSWEVNRQLLLMMMTWGNSISRF
jgi:hypothetical protein